MSTQSSMVILEKPQEEFPELEEFLRYPYCSYVWLRCEFAAICGDIAEALILRIVEYAIEGRRRAWKRQAEMLRGQGKALPKMPKTWWVALSYKKIMENLYELIKSENTVIAKIFSLLEKKFLRRRDDPKNPYGEPLYTINRRVVQSRLDALPPLFDPGQYADEDEEENGEFDEIESSAAPSEADSQGGEYQGLGGGVPGVGMGDTKNWGGGVPGIGTHLRSNKEVSKNISKKESAHSLLSSQINFEAVRQAPWSVGTILALSSHFLPVPSREAIEASGDAEALEAYCREWQHPAELLYAATCSLSPQLAWERVDLTTRYMGTYGSQSWWQRPAGDPRGWRKTKAPITLKNVAGRFLDEFDEFKHGSWYPPERTVYDGPPLDYEVGYGGTILGEAAADRIDTITEEPMTDEVPAVFPGPDSAITEITEEPATESSEEQREDEEQAVPNPPQGMSIGAAEHLTRRIKQRYPAISLGWQSVTEDGSRVLVCLEYAPDAWLPLGGMSEWLRPSPEAAALIDQAASFGVGMSWEVADRLIQRIQQRHPALSIGWRKAREDGQRVFVGIQYGPGDADWLDLYSADEWTKRTEETQYLIEQAIAFGEALVGSEAQQIIENMEIQGG